MLDAIEIEVQFVGMGLLAAERAAIVSEHRLHGQVQLGIERPYVVVQGVAGSIRWPELALTI